MQNSVSQQPDNINVTFRKNKFDFDSVTDRYWMRNNPFITHYFHALSSVIPDGEKWFMDSVRAFSEDIKDEKLLKNVEQFIKQEAHHAHQHNLLNKLAETHGVKMPRYMNIVKAFNALCEKTLNKYQQLSITIALEHFTATLGHQYLTNPEVARGMDKEVSDLWRWHSIEEIEHKSVAFDVYNAVGGTYFTRILLYLLINLEFWMGIYLFTLDMMREDGKLLDINAHLKGFWYMFNPRYGFLVRSLPDLLRYIKPGFHPWQKDNSRLIDNWVQGHQDYPITQ
jgi:predicted metal-dependent hydrolase